MDDVKEPTVEAAVENLTVEVNIVIADQASHQISSPNAF